MVNQESGFSISRRATVALPVILSALPSASSVMATTTGLKRQLLKGTDQEVVVLNNGTEMPLLGLGTSGLDDEAVEKAVKAAIGEAGYRHIDTAAMYGNEKGVGKGIKIVDRKDVYITTKLKNDDHARVAEAVQESLQRLDTDYLDTYVIHWPVTERPNKDGDTSPPIKETWQAMEKAVDQGYIKSIGVSNFSVKKLKDLQSYARIPPSVNQVEVHIWHRNDPLIKHCEETGVQIQAYSPMGGLPMWKGKRPKDDPLIIDIAKKYSKTPSQVLLRWNVQHGSCVIPKSGNPDRIKENAGLWGWTLDKEDFNAISNIKFQERMCKGEFFLEQSPANTLEELWDGEI